MIRAAVIAVIVAALLAAGPAAAGTFTVTVGPAGSLTFSPANQTIQVGDTVHWVWASGPHSTTSGSPPGTPDGKWESGIQSRPFSFDSTFTTPGTFQYFCAVHYAEGMIGTINVVAGTPPTAEFAVATASPVAGQPVIFDGSASSSPEGSISSYSWDFGDGSASGSGVEPSHTYALPGTYAVALTVTDSLGTSTSVSHTVTIGSVSGDEPPTAGFLISPASPLTGQAVSFDGTSSNDSDGSITSYNWDFGDGSGAGSGPQPTHPYALAGRYLVRLTVTDTDGQTSVDSRSVTVGQAPQAASTAPSATFSATPRSPVAGQRVTLDAAGSSDPSGSIVSYKWSFGDRSTNESGVAVHHIFKRHGTFAVGVVVTDGSGNTASHTINIEVRRPSRITFVRLRAQRHRPFLEIKLTGAGLLKFRLFGSVHRYRINRSRTLRVMLRPPAAVLDRLRQIHALRLHVALHFTPVVGGDSTVRIKLTISRSEQTVATLGVAPQRARAGGPRDALGGHPA